MSNIDTNYGNKNLENFDEKSTNPKTHSKLYKSFQKRNFDELKNYNTVPQIEQKIKELTFVIKQAEKRKLYNLDDNNNSVKMEDNSFIEGKKIVDFIVLLKLKLQDICDQVIQKEHKSTLTISKFPRLRTLSESVLTQKFQNSIHYSHVLNSPTGIIPKASYCEHCTLPTFIKSVHCSCCGIYLHEACVENFKRQCISSKSLSKIKNLFNQKITSSTTSIIHSPSCSDCKTTFDSIENLKFCHFSSKYYCSKCHWNDRAILPQNVLYNWDFSRMPVSRESFLLLKYFYKKPLLNVGCMDGQLYKKVKNLNKVQQIRNKLIEMNEYISKCPHAVKSRLILNSLPNRTYLVSVGSDAFNNSSFENLSESDDESNNEQDNSTFYSLKDAVDIATGKLISDLKQVSTIFSNHIKNTCQTCRGRGHYCKLCNQGSLHLQTFDDPLFPFDSTDESGNSNYVCKNCGAVYHDICVQGELNRLMGTNLDAIFDCKNCQMIKARKSKIEKSNLEDTFMASFDSFKKSFEETSDSNCLETKVGTSNFSTSSLDSKFILSGSKLMLGNCSNLQTSDFIRSNSTSIFSSKSIHSFPRSYSTAFDRNLPKKNVYSPMGFGYKPEWKS